MSSTKIENLTRFFYIFVRNILMPTKVYLDNCCFNRPFDNQNSVRVRVETEAKLEIQNRILNKEIILVWSYILDYENQKNPFQDRKEAISIWKEIANEDVNDLLEDIKISHELTNQGIKPLDALHIGCAIRSKCDYFITTDDRILKKNIKNLAIKIINPVEFIILEE